MKILAIDTATDACSAALFLDDAASSRFELAPRRHTELILPMAGELLAAAGLAAADLDAIAFGRGPGAFTGLRIAAGVAQGLALGAGLPVIPVSTLATMAQQVMDEQGAERVMAALDARMGEVYWGCYRRAADGVAEPVGEEVVCAPGAVPLPPGEGGDEAGDAGWVGVGSGFAAHAEALQARLGGRLARTLPDVLPAARAMQRLAARAYAQGDCLPAEAAQPVYLRDNVAVKPGQDA
ncbi:MAG: tRNA (adenosine(37)-N6)-threonylcarbamoyltransferase complex dimerization subunit type 1 TsaB [Chromatiales bacterium]|nr:tRNA (adenosine(37)-N6)-threonylcarbamoyltransferase complex dimerization subunit type 1 TsaB [Chromatiales bacterium]